MGNAANEGKVNQGQVEVDRELDALAIEVDALKSSKADVDFSIARLTKMITRREDALRLAGLLSGVPGYEVVVRMLQGRD